MAPHSDEATTFSVVELGREESLELLARSGIGRVTFSVHGVPVALPVNVALLDDDVVFATDKGSKLDAAVQGRVMSIEADGVDKVYHTGWSVVVTGVGEVLTDPRNVERVRRLPLQAWAPGPHPFIVRVPSSIVSGRRLAWEPGTDTGDKR